MGAVLPSEGSTCTDFAADAQKLHPPAHFASPSRGVPTRPHAAAATTRILLADSAMVLCQLLLFLNHYRRLLDASQCARDGRLPDVPTPGPLAAYPCSSPPIARISYVVRCAGTVFHASFLLPKGELWVPVASSVILAQLLAILFMPRGAYLAFGRRTCMVLVGLAPKAVSLATFLAFPQQRPSTYFCTYLPLEGAITVWQQVVYNYPFWTGMVLLATHCALSTAICATVGPRLHAAGAPPLFNTLGVLLQTYFCAALAAGVALQQHPASALSLRAAVRRLLGRADTAAPPSTAMAAPGSGCRSGGRASGGGAAAAIADVQLLQVAYKLLLAGSRSSSSSSPTSVTAAGSTISSSSLDSSAPASEVHSTAGSGSHAAAAGLAMSGLATGAAAAAAVEEAEYGAPAAVPQPRQQQLEPERGSQVPAVLTKAGPLPTKRGSPLASHERTGAAAGAGGTAGASPSAGSGHKPYVPFPRRVAAMPPTGAFSLKQPTGLSKWTIVEDQEFQAPHAVGVSGSLAAIGLLAARSGRFRRYQSRAPTQRVYMKIPWAEPDQLPANFLERLNVALSEGLDCMAVGVSARAGCIELVFDVVPQGAFDSANNYLAGLSRHQHLGLMPAGATQQQQRRHAHSHLELLSEVGIRVGAGAGDADGDAGEGGLGGEGGLLDSHGALEEAVLSGLLHDAEPASWIEALHLQPPPGAEVLTQACGRVWISRWDHTLRQWIPEKAGGIRPSQLPRITRLKPPCILLPPPGDKAGPPASLCVTVSNADNAPAFSARCRGRYLPVNMRPSRSRCSDGATVLSDDGAGSAASPPTSGPLNVPVDDSASRLGTVRLPGGRASVVLELPAGLPRNGLVVVECKVGKLLSNWRPVIVTEDALLAADLASLHSTPAEADGAAHGCSLSSASDASDAAASCDELLTDLGLWLDYLEVRGLNGGGGRGRSSAPAGTDLPPDGTEPRPRLSGSLDFGQGLAALYGTERYRAHMAGIAVSLLEYAVDRGWNHTAGLLVDQMLSAGIPWCEVLQRCSDGLTLLHRAVRSSHCDMVELVVGLGEQHGTPFDWQAVSLAPPEDPTGDADAAGVTPLHLAAALPDGGRLAERILSEYHTACQLWASALDSHGVRPVDCARASGQRHLTDEAAGPASPLWRRLPEEAAAAAPAAPAAASPLGPGGCPADPAAQGKTKAAVEPGAGVNGCVPQAGVLEGGRAGEGGGGGGGGRVRAAAAAAAARSVVTLLAAPFVNDRRSESLYVQTVGARYKFWFGAYLVYEMCLVAAVGGRMVKELRASDAAGMLIFLSPHVASALLLCFNYAAWLRLREPLCAAVTVTRTLAKLMPAMGRLPYPSSSTNYLSGGMDALLEGLVPAFFERMRAPLALLLRAVEGVVTGLLYQELQRTGQHAVAPVAALMTYALSWTLGCGVISAVLDARDRRSGMAGGGWGRLSGSSGNSGNSSSSELAGRGAGESGMEEKKDA